VFYEKKIMMDRTPGHTRHMSKKEWRKRANISAALSVLACSWMNFGAFRYSEKYIAGARRIVEKAEKEGYFEIGGNNNGRD